MPAQTGPAEDLPTQTLQEHLEYITHTDPEARPKHLRVNEKAKPNQPQSSPNPATLNGATNTDPTMKNILELPDVVAEQGYPQLVTNPTIGMWVTTTGYSVHWKQCTNNTLWEYVTNELDENSFVKLYTSKICRTGNCDEEQKAKLLDYLITWIRDDA